jgi:hypothetical protein
MSIFTIPIAIMAVLTNITAVGRLRDAKKELDKKDRQKKIEQQQPVKVQRVKVL